jgi:hypothetical protein
VCKVIIPATTPNGSTVEGREKRNKSYDKDSRFCRAHARNRIVFKQ